MPRLPSTPSLGSPATPVPHKPSATPQKGKAPLTVEIANQHPRLRFRRAEVKRLFSILEQSRESIVLPKTLPKPPRDRPDEPLTAARQINGSSTLSIVFMTDAALAQLHADFLDDPTPTDVITFEGSPELGTAGEICVSADRAAAYAAAKPDRDFSRELALYLVHGWLHLAGYDDLAPPLKRQMRAAEARALHALDTAHAIPRFTFAQAAA